MKISAISEGKTAALKLEEMRNNKEFAFLVKYQKEREKRSHKYYYIFGIVSSF